MLYNAGIKERGKKMKKILNNQNAVVALLALAFILTNTAPRILTYIITFCGVYLFVKEMKKIISEMN